jgi:hypothetical protein
MTLLLMSTLKLCFLLDCTSSMSPWITLARNRIQEIIENVKADNPNTRVEIAYVGYRDFDVNCFDLLDFTQNIELFKKHLGEIKVFGGEDFAEDVAGGLYLVFEDLAWELDKDYTRMIVHIADAPAHGDMFASANDDQHPGKSHELIEQINECITNDINYTFIRVDDSTDRMTNKIQEMYGDKFTLLNLIEPGTELETTFSRDLSRTITMTVNRYGSQYQEED